MDMLFDAPGNTRPVPLTIYTDQLIVRGIVQTSQHRVTDILNMAPEPHLVLEDVTIEEYGSSETPIRAEFAQVNLGSVLFAVSLTAVETTRELRTPKVSERALISVPPFRVVGSVHLLADRGLRASLAELRGLFVPVTDATFSADRVGEARQTVPYLAVNHARAQVFAPYREVDPWAGMARPAAAVDATGVMGADTAPEPSGVFGNIAAPPVAAPERPAPFGAEPPVGSTPPLAAPAPAAPAPGAPFGHPTAGAPQGEPAFIPGFGVPPVPAPASPPVPAPTTPPDPTVA